MPGQARRTTGRIHSRAMTTEKYKWKLTRKCVVVVLPAPSSTSTHPRTILLAFHQRNFESKMGWKERTDPRPTLENLLPDAFEKKTLKGTGGHGKPGDCYCVNSENSCCRKNSFQSAHNFKHVALLKRMPYVNDIAYLVQK